MTAMTIATCTLGAFVCIGIAALFLRCASRTARDFKRERARRQLDEMTSERFNVTRIHGGNVEAG